MSTGEPMSQTVREIAGRCIDIVLGNIRHYEGESCSITMRVGLECIAQKIRDEFESDEPIADLRAQLQAAEQERDQFSADELRTARALMAVRGELRVSKQLADERGRELQTETVKRRIAEGDLASADFELKSRKEEIDERGREVERLRAALKRNRQGYRNILEFRKLNSDKWGMRDGYGGRYGALTREEIETVIAEIDTALAAPAAPEAQR